MFLSTNCVFAQDIKTPLEYNNYLVSIISELANMGNQWGIRLRHLDSTTMNFAELITLRTNMEKYIDEKTAELQKMKDLKGSEKFRNATINFLAFEKILVKNGFAPFEKLNKNSSQADFDKANNNLINEAKNEETAMKKLRDEQQAYAEKNNFKIDMQ
jgi:hypothetical protein